MGDWIGQKEQGKSGRRTWVGGWGKQWEPETMAKVEAMAAAASVKMRMEKQTLMMKNDLVVVGQMATLVPRDP